MTDSPPQTAANSAAELLKQGAGGSRSSPWLGSSGIWGPLWCLGLLSSTCPTVPSTWLRGWKYYAWDSDVAQFGGMRATSHVQFGGIRATFHASSVGYVPCPVPSSVGYVPRPVSSSVGYVSRPMPSSVGYVPRLC